MSEVTVTTQLARIQTDPNAGPNPVALAFFEETTTIDGKQFIAPWSSVSWPLLSDKTVTLSDGTVLSYAQVSEGVTMIAYQERAAQNEPPAAPEEPTAEEDFSVESKEQPTVEPK